MTGASSRPLIHSQGTTNNTWTQVGYQAYFIELVTAFFTLQSVYRLVRLHSIGYVTLELATDVLDDFIEKDYYFFIPSVSRIPRDFGKKLIQKRKL